MNPSFSLSARDLWLLALLTLTWGLNWPIMKIGVQDFPPLTFRAISVVGGLPVMWLLVRWQGLSLRVPREDWPEMFKLGLFNMVGWFLLVIYGVKLLSSGRAAILGYTMPIWVALIGIAVYGDKPARRLIWGVVAAAGGVVLLVASELSTLTGRPVGTVCMLVAAATWAWGTQMMRRRRLTAPVPVVTFWSLAMVSVICTVLAVIVESGQWVRWPSQPEWLSISYNALVIFGFSQWLWFRLAAMLPPVASGLSVMLIPVVGLFSGMALLGERPHWQDWVAVVCIVFAMAAVLLPARPVAGPRG
jgi:drug/metabolite transporter (DMT)-like permease